MSDHTPTATPGAESVPGEGGGRLARFRRTRWWRWGRWPLFAGGAVALGCLVGLVWIYVTVQLPDEPPQIESSRIVDADGEELAVLQKDGLRVEVDLDEVDPIVVEALIAAEDRGFRDHGGIDPLGIARAAVNNIRGGETQGGSTLTQQLVKNSYLSSERTYSRKLREAVLAIKLDRSEDKDHILERYLNTVYFGRGAYGIEAAANVYFDTSAADLSVPQAALLVGLLRAPESADPTNDPETATNRRNSVIDDLAEVGEITEAEAEEHKAAELGATDLQSPVTLTAGIGAHVVEWIRAEAVERFGAEAVYGGGLTIQVTIDIDDQRAAEEAVAAVLTEADDPQAALVAVDADGAIRAHVGGRDFAALQTDLARGAAGGGQGRQPGSTFKPFVLAAALEDGTATLGSTYPAPPTLTLDAGGAPWTVDNYGGEGGGVTDLAGATAGSVNTVYAQLLLDVGPERAVEVARALGITADLQPDPSIVLGTGEVSVTDMASAYSTFAREGQRIDPYLIVEVTDRDDEVIFTADEPSPERAMDAGAARAVTHALRGVIDDGTGTRARLDRPAAGKTGTTQDNVDAWFAGYTPTYTAAVWMGYPEGSRPMDDVHGGPVTGGSLPAEIWKRFMDAALADVEPADFAPPPDELLQPPEEPERTLTLSPDRGPVGTRVTVTVTGFEQCIAGWSATLDPGGATTGPQPGGTEDERTAVLVVPDGLGPGSARVTAVCDRGAGREAVVDATFTVEGPPESSTTTTEPPSSTTTTSEPPTTTEPPSTTTTEPPPPTSAPGGQERPTGEG